MHQQLPNAHQACCSTSSRPGCYCSRGLMLARSPLSTQTRRKLSKLQSHPSQFSNPSILEASQMLRKQQNLHGPLWPCDPLLSYGLIVWELKCSQHLWVYAVHISNHLGRKQSIKEKKIILENPFLNLVNASRDCKNIQVQSNRKVWKFYFKGFYYLHLEQIVLSYISPRSWGFT